MRRRYHLVPGRGGDQGANEVAGPGSAQPPAWPPMPKSLSRHSQTTTGIPALGVVLAYGGANVLLIGSGVVLLLVVLCVPVFLWQAQGLLLPLLGFLLASVLVTRLGRGALVASTDGLEFTPYDRTMRTPKTEESVHAAWSDVSVEPGFVSRFTFGDHQIQVGPRNRAFVDAAQHEIKAMG